MSLRCSYSYSLSQPPHSYTGSKRTADIRRVTGAIAPQRWAQLATLHAGPKSEHLSADSSTQL
jgi:hypothetical protein